jgi:hypothetical protein
MLNAASDTAAWQKVPTELAAEAEQLESQFILALQKANGAPNDLAEIPVDVPFGQDSAEALSSYEMLLLSERKESEFAKYVFRDASKNTLVVRGTARQVGVPLTALKKGAVREFVHTQPGINEVIPGLADLENAVKMDEATMTIVARAEDGKTLVKLSYTPEESKRLFAYRQANTNDSMQKFYTEVAQKLHNEGISFPTQWAIDARRYGVFIGR